MIASIKDGEWTVSTDTGITIATIEGPIIWETPSTLTVAEAWAKLFAASPLLYAELVELYNVYTNPDDVVWDNHRVKALLDSLSDIETINMV